jgi:uncharacterized protein DUF6930
MGKLAPLPPVAPKTWNALFTAATDFAALKPWEFAYDSDAVGLIDPETGERRIATVLGNAGEVFAAVFYRRGGLRWILSMLSDSPNPEDLNNSDGMDCLKLEFVPKRELWKEDLAVLKTAAFKPFGKGAVWPQFRSSDPGWHPWHINQIEADQLLVDLPRLTAFCRMFKQHPALFDKRDATEIPFIPTTLPVRPLAPEDLNWQPLILPPNAIDPFQIPGDKLEKLRSLKHAPEMECEFDSTLLPGGSFIENGRPCFGRFSLLVEKQRGLVIGMGVHGGALSPGDAAGKGLTEGLLMAGQLPGKIYIGGSRFQAVLKPLCDELEIQLIPAASLPLLEEALHSLSEQMLAIGEPH